MRAYTRCQRCGRPKAVYRKFGLCRICIREMAHQGELPGVSQGLLVTTSYPHFAVGPLRHGNRGEKGLTNT